MNDGISSDYTTVSYATVENAIGLIKSVGPNCFLAKTDVKNAFRLVPIHPEDYDLLGIYWQGQYYYDRCMPMGCSSSCKTFEMFTTVLEWIAQNKLHIPYILHLLDDFLIISPSNESCQHQLDTFLMLCSFLGIPMAPEKTVGPSTTLAFAGIQLDTAVMEARLPQEKLDKCWDLLSTFLRRRKVTFQDIRSLTGLLNFVCLERNICFKAKHIPGVHNVLDDALSQLKLQTFKQLPPACMNPHPTEIPHHLQPISWHQ